MTKTRAHASVTNSNLALTYGFHHLRGSQRTRRTQRLLVPYLAQPLHSANTQRKKSGGRRAGRQRRHSPRPPASRASKILAWSQGLLVAPIARGEPSATAEFALDRNAPAGWLDLR